MLGGGGLAQAGAWEPQWLWALSVPYPFPMALQVDGVSYLLQEIYGIENKYNTQDSKVCACIPGVFPRPFFPSPSTGLANETCSGQEFAAQHRAGHDWGPFMLASKLLQQKTEGLSFPPSFVVPWGKGDGLDGEHGAQGMGCALCSALTCKNWVESLGFCFL